MGLRGGETGQTADIVSQLLDGVMAVVKEFILEEVTQLQKIEDKWHSVNVIQNTTSSVNNVSTYCRAVVLKPFHVKGPHELVNSCGPPSEKKCVTGTSQNIPIVFCFF